MEARNSCIRRSPRSNSQKEELALQIFKSCITIFTPDYVGSSKPHNKVNNLKKGMPQYLAFFSNIAFNQSEVEHPVGFFLAPKIFARYLLMCFINLNKYMNSLLLL